MKEIIVVEGRDDTKRLKLYFPDIETIETNGSAIDEETIALIKKAHHYRGVIILTDPDYPGEKIRKVITQAIPTVTHAFLTVEEALPKNRGSLGVEHASKEALQRALSQVRQVDNYQTDNDITTPFLVRYSLIGAKNSAIYRNQLAKKLNIGHVNGKQFLKRLHMFNITKEQLLTTFEQILLERDED